MTDEEIEIEGIENEPDTDYDEESTYDPKSEFKKPLLAMEAVKSCREARAKEMTKGFWNMKLDKQGNAIRIWISDERKIFINSVIALEKLLSAECLKDKKYQEFKKKIGIEIKKIFEKFAYNIFEYEYQTGGWKKTDTKIIPQIEEELMMPSLLDPKVLSNIKGGWDFRVNAYWDELVPLYDQVFEELNKVIFRLNDFSQKFSY